MLSRLQGNVAAIRRLLVGDDVLRRPLPRSGFVRCRFFGRRRSVASAEPPATKQLQNR